ncbi:hypothetical protein PR202_gb26897 [Eleusine coracana subsp. coracana]|uniref:RING-type domain-containing protein n=1 Tax=Eleusine coracana subsp. coracana TaxID=191504 RepID=A0AAV5FSW9_ELECO|nr:hypothetical protein QOZ80_1BG0052930 [Eleusine coracana subsp. coracana]GJN37898.1 hypothetical protein PR202_gb26897 [Eleusine coracana subsp. coracana]
MEVGGALASALFAAVSLPCLVLLLVLGEAGLRVAALALRGAHGWPTRSAFLGYRISRPTTVGSSSSSHYSSVFRDGGDDEPPLPAACCDRLPRATYRRRAGAGAMAADPECAFCLSAVRDGDEVRELRCQHVFHRACLDAWLVRPRATCPLCRDRLLPADPPPQPAGDDDDLDAYFAVDEEDDADIVSASATAAAYAHGGGALWHMT